MEDKTEEVAIVFMTVEIAGPFCDFLREYLAFFGSNMTVEELCAQMVHEESRRLHDGSGCLKLLSQSLRSGFQRISPFKAQKCLIALQIPFGKHPFQYNLHYFHGLSLNLDDAKLRHHLTATFETSKI